MAKFYLQKNYNREKKDWEYHAKETGVGGDSFVVYTRSYVKDGVTSRQSDEEFEKFAIDQFDKWVEIEKSLRSKVPILIKEVEI